jgi:hypothetical protein
MIEGDAIFIQAVTSGLFAAMRFRHDAERSVGKVAAFLVGRQYAMSMTSSSLH